ncbi:MAG: phage holin family protein [Verrucomicrobiae bacterium]|nr:phage holin family protein [Verrucomicrobiae bacterium]
MSAPPRIGSWFSSIKHLSESILEAIKTRMELFCLEWQEEKKRVFILFVSAIIGVVLFFLFLFSFTAAIIISTWETDYRYAVVWALSALYALLTGLSVWIVIRQVKLATPPFKATIEELRKDYSWLRSHN